MGVLIEPTIRLATLDDAKGIAVAHICSWQAIYKAFIPEAILQNLSVTKRTTQWLTLLKEGISVLVVEVKNSIIGFASICSFREEEPNPLKGEVSAIYLHPNYWYQGIGSKLFVAALSELQRAGYQEIYVWVLSDNTQARRFYESFGFKTTNSTKLEEFYEGGALLTQILYKKDLKSFNKKGKGLK